MKNHLLEFRDYLIATNYLPPGYVDDDEMFINMFAIPIEAFLRFLQTRKGQAVLDKYVKKELKSVVPNRSYYLKTNSLGEAVDQIRNRVHEDTRGEMMKVLKKKNK